MDKPKDCKDFEHLDAEEHWENLKKQFTGFVEDLSKTTILVC